MSRRPLRSRVVASRPAAVGRALLGALAMVLLAAYGAAPAYADDGPRVLCRFDDARLDEISGITWSARHPGVYWLHNDSGGGPYLYAVDGTTCRTLARIRIAGIGARDMEAIATGVDPQGRPVLWVGDIGDNNDDWPEVRVHAVREPAELVDQEVRATTYRFTYADGSHNAEALLASPTDARVWVVTKQLARGSVWRVPLRRSGVATASKEATVGGLVTDGAVSPDGARFVLRDYLGARLFAWPPSNASVTGGERIALPAQPQGEAISFTADGSALVTASERDDALWLVPLPAADVAPTGTASPGGTASLGGTAEPTGGDGGTTAASTPTDDDASPSGAPLGGPAGWLVLAAAVAGAVGIGAWATRRHRH